MLEQSEAFSKLKRESCAAVQGFQEFDIIWYWTTEYAKAKRVRHAQHYPKHNRSTFPLSYRARPKPVTKHGTQNIWTQSIDRKNEKINTSINLFENEAVPRLRAPNDARRTRGPPGRMVQKVNPWFARDREARANIEKFETFQAR